LYFSDDLGETWQLIHDLVNPRFFWAVPGGDADESIVHMELEDPTTGQSELYCHYMFLVYFSHLLWYC